MADIKVYEPVGRCIYCGVRRYNTDGREGELAVEHIIPLALDGTLILPASSCQSCERITGRLEQVVLRGSLHGIREHLGLRSREKEGRPTTLPIFIPQGSGQPDKRMDIPVEDYPTSLLMVTTTEANILSGLAQPQNAAAWFYQAKDIGQFAQKYKIPSFAGVSLDTTSFMRMIAKIAHSFLAAERGLDSFKPTLTDLILGNTGERYDYVGGSLEISPPVGDLHQIAIEPTRTANGRTFIMVRIRLFSNLGAPTYYVVAGEPI